MSSELHFQPTDAFRSAWKRVLAHADALPSDRMNDVNVLRSISIETSKGIPFSTIKLVSALYKQLVTIKGKSKIESTTTTENGTSGYTGDGSLYSLMQGISLVKEAKKSKGYVSHLYAHDSVFEKHHLLLILCYLAMVHIPNYLFNLMKVLCVDMSLIDWNETYHAIISSP